MNGKLAEVRIWSTLRTEEQIKENANKTMSADEPDLMHYFRLDNSSFLNYQIGKIHDVKPSGIIRTPSNLTIGYKSPFTGDGLDFSGGNLEVWWCPKSNEMADFCQKTDDL